MIMELPNYFIADLHPEAALTAKMLREACDSLRQNRERYLRPRTTEQIIRIIARLADNWLDPEFPFRRHVLAKGPEATGFSESILEHGLDCFFRQITSDSLTAFMQQELGHPGRLDTFRSDVTEQRFQRSALAHGPQLLVHICAGKLPNPTLTSIITGLLVQSAQVVKCATGGSFIPRMFAHSLYQADPKMASCLEIVEWRGGHEPELESVLFGECDVVTATGADETLAAIRQQLPPNVRFIGYGHRVSFGYVASDALDGHSVDDLVRRAADDIVAWDQLGCLSPHLFYVEAGGPTTPEKFAERLANELAGREHSTPRGRIHPDAAGAIAYRRSFYEVRSASNSDTKLWKSDDSTAWTVIYEPEPQFQLSCLHRFVLVKGVAGLDEALAGLDAWREKISTVGLAAGDDKRRPYAERLARLGASRICPIGRMQNPSLFWHHDGRPALADLVTWTDWEF